MRVWRTFDGLRSARGSGLGGSGLGWVQALWLVTVLIHAGCTGTTYAPAKSRKFVPAGARWERDPEAVLNFYRWRGERPNEIPSAEPWPQKEEFRQGRAEAPRFIWVDGYSCRKQRCTWLHVTRRNDGSLEAKYFDFYRVGDFADGSSAFEMVLGNGGYLALRINPKVGPLQTQIIQSTDSVDPEHPSTWESNVLAAWFGESGEKPIPIKVAEIRSPLPDGLDAQELFDEVTNHAIKGPNADVCEPKLDWSQLITLRDPFADDPLIPQPPSSTTTTAGGGATCVMLVDGQILVVGGWIDGVSINSAEIFDPTTGKFSKTGECRTGHGRHALAVCGNGKVLLVPGYGSSPESLPELYDPKSGTWSALAPMNRPCYCPVSVELTDGRALVCDGSGVSEKRSAEIFDPNTCTWSITPEITVVDSTTTLTRLQDGRVLMVGRSTSLGVTGIGTSVARIYDPMRNTWIEVAAPGNVRCRHTSTLLKDGRVLVAGGAFFKPSAEIYDPTTNAWTTTEPMATDRAGHAATLLQDGRVLVFGGSFPSLSAPDLPVGEIFDPETGKWFAAAKSAAISNDPTAFTLRDGRVLVVSGEGSAKLFEVKR